MKNIVAAVLIVLGCSAWAGEYEDGMAAYEKKEYLKAVSKFRIASAQGSALAQYMLGNMYHEGQGVAQNFAESTRWYKLSAAQGEIFAQLSLGNSYQQGEGVSQNYILAHMWWNLAAAQGDDLSKLLRDDLAKVMTSQQIAQAQKLARECQARNYKRCD